MPNAKFVPLPFREAIDYFAGKVQLPTDTWTDILQEQHTKAFVVAGAKKAALVGDFQNALAKALDEGTSLEEFRADFDRIVKDHGWSYKGKRGWRSRVIYETNMRQAYASGRWSQIEKVKKLRPYLRYVAVLDGRERKSHRALHGLIYPVDHAFWDKHYPPNGWGCRCSVESLSERDMKKNDYTASTTLPPGTDTHTIRRGGRDVTVTTPHGVSPAFAYNPGRNRLSGLTPPPGTGAPVPGAGPAATGPMPAPRPFNKARLVEGPNLTEPDYARAFLKEFDADLGKPAVHIDKAGEAIPISEDLFRTATGEWKVTKSGREVFVRLLADNIKDPDEIWFDWYRDGGGVYHLRRRYISRFDLDGRQQSGYTVFEITPEGWREVTNFAPKSDKSAAAQDRYLDMQRHGLRVYSRE